MATTYTADQAAASFPTFDGGAGQVMCAYGVYEVAVALVQNDVIKFCKVPANSVVLGGWFRGDDIDTGTEVFDFDIGTSADTDAFLNSGVITGDATTDVKPEVSILYQLNGTLKDGPQLVTAETTIQGICNVAANAGGTGTLSVTVLYTQNINVGNT